MKYIQFDKMEVKEAINQIDNDPQLALEKFKNYIEKYPTHYSIYSFYISSLISTNNIEEAEKVINYIETLKYDNFFLSKKNIYD